MASLQSTTINGILTVNLSSGTMISSSAMTDMIGWNASYGSYIGSTVGSTTYIYGNGSFYDGSANRTLLHSANVGTYAFPRSGSWAADLVSSYGFTREHGIQMTGGSEFVVLSKSGQGYLLVDGSYYAAEAGGFYSTNNSSGGTLLGFYADTTTSLNFNTATVKLNSNQILHAGNYNSYAPTLTGTGASGSWAISVTGSASSATTATDANLLISLDDRTIAPNEIGTSRLRFGFTSWTNNNTSPWADYLHLRSYGDNTGGNDNLVMFRKDAIGMRIYQQAFGSASAYSSYKDVAFTDQSFYIGTTQIAINRTSASQTLNGVSIDGNAANITAYTINQNLGTSNSPSFVRLTSTQATGTAPFTVSSTTAVSNLNSDLLDGQHGSYYQDPYNFTLPTSWRVPIQTGNSVFPFLYGTFGDALAFKTISNLQYWDGSAWQTYSNTGIQNILTGNIQGSTATVTPTNKKFRFEFTADAAYLGGGVLVVHQTWNNGAHQVSSMLEYYNGTSWVTIITEKTSAGGESDYHFYNRGDIHGNWTQYRVTITGADTVNNASYVGIQLLYDYTRAGLPNNFLPITWDYAKNVTTTGSFRAPIFYDSDNTNYYLDPASTSILNALTTGVIKGDSGSDYPHSFTNTDSGNTHWTNRSNRLLTSNGTNWATDGRDPIMALVTSGNSNATTIGNSIGLALHNESTTDNTFSPAIVFSNRSNSTSYNTAYAAIIGRKTGQGVDSNWSAGELHFYTMPVGAYINNTPSLLINSSGDVTAARYLVGTYVNTSDNVPTSENISYVMAKFGDNYHRSASAAKVAGFISGQSMNINGSSTSCTGNAATATNSTQLGGYDSTRFLGSRSSNISAFDFNNLTSNDIYSTGAASWAGSSNYPTNAVTGNSYQYGTIVNFASLAYSSGILQTYWPDNDTTGFYFRQKWSTNAWTGRVWQQVLTNANYNSFAPTLTGTGASGSWGISITGNAATVTNGVYTNTDQNITGVKTVYVTSNTLINTVASQNRGLAIYQDTVNTDAYMTFHIGNDYAGYFGLGGTENDLVWGGWSVGNNRYRILHSGNAAYAWNMNQNVRTTDTATFAGVRAGDGSLSAPSYSFSSDTNTGMYLYGADILGMSAGGVLGFAMSSSSMSTILPYLFVGGMTAWNTTTPGTTKGFLHLGDASSTANSGVGITWGARDSSSGTTAQAGIYVITDGSYGTKMYFATTNNYGTGAQMAMRIEHTGDVIFSRGNVGVGTSPAYKLDVNGACHASSFPTSSDARFKKNIKPIQNSLDKINKINGVVYEWNEFVHARRDGYELNTPIIGVIAQDLEKVLPEVVSKWSLSEDCPDARAVDYIRIIPVLIEAIKELNNKNSILEARILALENKQ